LFKERRATVTGLKDSDQAQLIEKMEVAGDRYDARELASLLDDATKNGVDFSSVAQYRIILQQLQSENFIKQAMLEAEAEVKKIESDQAGDAPAEQTRQLWRLINLSDQLQTLGGDEKLTRGARMTVTVASRQSTLLAAGDAGAAELETLFGDIGKFPGLKPESKMKYSRTAIKEALTRVPAPAFEQEAVRNFRNILVWMTDRAGSDIERQSALDSVVRLLRMTDELRDEIYIQVMKQLIHNPSLRSIALGWELLILLCQSMLPSDQLFAFFQKFLQEHSTAADQKVGEMARRCLSAIAGLGMLPRLKGFLAKSRPKATWTRAFDTRFFILRNMHLYWWKTKDEAESAEARAPDGGPKCRGYISLAAACCTVTAVQAQPTQFLLTPSASGWAKGRMEEEKTREFTFDTKGGTISRDEWVKSMAAHIKQAEAGKCTRLNDMVQAFFLQGSTGDAE